MRLGIAQLRFEEPRNSEQRLKMTEDALTELAHLGADVALLPELAASGYVLDVQHLKTNAEPSNITGRMLSTWAAAAQHHKITIVGGYCEVSNGRLYNSAIAISPTGSVLCRYRKLHLFGAEHGILEPGNVGIPVFEIGETRVALLICYDLRFPESVRLAALQGADLVLVPTAWVGGFDQRPPGSPRQIGQIEAAITHADLNQVFIACADQAGHADDKTFLGRSVVIDPYGEMVVGPLSPQEPATVVAELTIESAQQAQYRGPGISPRANRRLDVYDALLGYQPVDPQEDPT